MTNKIQLRREYLLKLLHRSEANAFTIEELQSRVNEYLDEHGFNIISRRTLDSDIAALSKDGEIANSRVSTSGYISERSYKYVRYVKNPIDFKDEQRLSKENLKILESVASELDHISGNPFVDELRIILSEKVDEKGNKALSNNLFVHLDTRENYLGRKNIAPLYDAVKNKYAIKFLYKSFGEDPRDVLLSPYILKQYNHRWYCIGKEHGKDSLVNIALDRVNGEIQKTDGYHPTMRNRNDWNDRFQEIVGVTYSEDTEPTNIHLRFYGKSRGYVLTKPLSICQRPIPLEELKNDPIDVYLEDIKVNFELKQQIMFYLDQVEVVQPKWLREEIKALFKKGAERNN